MKDAWDSYFYYQLGIPYEYSWSLFRYNKPSLTQNTPPDEPYALLCGVGSDNVDRLDYSHIEKNLLKIHSNHGGFFDNIDLINNATEIHCVNSSYIHLIDRLDSVDQHKTKLFYHKNYMPKIYSEFTLKKNWSVL
jgi:hypothetical protein